MTLAEIARILDAAIECCPEKESMEITGVYASDLMSDVLALTTPGGILLTGLANAQSIVTAVVAEVAAVLYLRGKRPEDGVLEFVKKKGIPVLTCGLSMYEACGRMYRAERCPPATPGATMSDDSGFALREKSFIKGGDFSHAGQVSTSIKSMLKGMSFPASVIRRVVIATYEAEMNVVVYADEAEVTFEATPQAVTVTLRRRGA